VVPWGIAVELEPREPIFEKYSHLREKGGGADQNLGSFGIGCPVQYACMLVSRQHSNSKHEALALLNLVQLYYHALLNLVANVYNVATKFSK
jgi:hypothetical protein